MGWVQARLMCHMCHGLVMDRYSCYWYIIGIIHNISILMYHYWYNHWIIIKIMPCVIIMHDYMELLVLLVLSISIWNIVGKSMHSIGLY
jgi:hypothetical protein